jgi:hypothetical protein
MGIKIVIRISTLAMKFLHKKQENLNIENMEIF